MPTLYVENVPKDLYEALRERAREAHRSIAAEVVFLLEQNIPSEKQLRARRELMHKLTRLRSRRHGKRRFPSTEQMLREDRSR